MKKNIFIAALFAFLLAFVACEPVAPTTPVDPETPGKTDPDPENPDPENPDKPEEIVIETEGAVDLGLSVKWAAYNMGASVPEEFGDYYGWGETEIRTDERTWKSCIWYGGYRGFTKYTSNPDDEGFDGKYILEAEDDIATVSLGDGWRMPSEEEMRDLVMKCTWTAHELNSVKGYIVTGPSGKSIFMPKAGYIELDEAEPRDIGNSLWFWTAQGATSSNLPDRAYAYNSEVDYMNFLINHPVYYKVCGMSVRPVYGDPIPHNEIINDWSTKGEISVSAVSAELRSLILSTSDQIESYGLCYSKTNQEPTLADAYAEGELVNGNHVHTQIKGLEPSTTYYYRSWIKIAGETHYSNYAILETKDASTMVETGSVTKRSTSSATVNATFTLKDVLYDDLKLGICFSEKENPVISSNFVEISVKDTKFTGEADIIGLSEGKTYHYRAVIQVDGQVIYGEDKSFETESAPEVLCAVDLGLPSGTKWANMNVGASSSIDVGDYFAWGEISPKDYYDKTNYKWYDYDTHQFTKYGHYDKDYCTSPDGRYKLLYADDAAYQNSGETFRMPTIGEVIELLDTNYTSTSIETIKGTKGVRITSKKNKNSIFVPVSGEKVGNELLYGDTHVEFMSSSRRETTSGHIDESRGAFIDVSGEEAYIRIVSMSRFAGTPVRGVLVK